MKHKYIHIYIEIGRIKTFHAIFLQNEPLIFLTLLRCSPDFSLLTRKAKHGVLVSPELLKASCGEVGIVCACAGVPMKSWLNQETWGFYHLVI
jgi:hypothetical protein